MGVTGLVRWYSKLYSKNTITITPFIVRWPALVDEMIQTSPKEITWQQYLHSGTKLYTPAFGDSELYTPCELHLFSRGWLCFISPFCFNFSCLNFLYWFLLLYLGPIPMG